MPYTYLIYNLTTKQYYYGVRYSKNCHPTDLWKTYFTSSTAIRQLISLYGKEDFLVTIRKTFNSSQQARKWEHKLLRRINAAGRSDFLNKNNSVCPTGQERMWITDGTTNKFIDIHDRCNYATWQEGKIISQETSQKISNARKLQHIVNRPKHTSAQKLAWSKQRKGRVNGRNTSKPIKLYNKEYPNIVSAMAATGLSRYKILQLVT